MLDVRRCASVVHCAVFAVVHYAVFADVPFVCTELLV